MNKSTTGGDRNNPGGPASEEPAVDHATKSKRPPSPRKCRDFIRRETANAMPAIVSTFVEEARMGSVAHFNALARVGGFDQRSAQNEAPKPKRRSLARQLLDEVERYEARQAAELAAANASTPHNDDQVHNSAPQERS